MLRPIEQMLGMQPLNERDTAATPMYDAFTNKPNFTPYIALPNRISLTYGLTTPPSCGYDQVPAQYANLVSGNASAIPASEEKTAALWKTWASQRAAACSGGS